MDSAIVVAVISLLVSAGTALWTRHENRRIREEERRATAREILTRYREPLLDAADQLHHRIRNIREDEFLGYLESSRCNEARQTTMFRFARYFGVLEILYSELVYLRFDTAEETQTVASVISEIGRTFATDYNGTDECLMIWREEQRAMGEVATARDCDGERRLVGYSEFVDALLSEDGSKWFVRFQGDLETAGAADSRRLRELQAELQKLRDLLATKRQLTV